MNDPTRLLASPEATDLERELLESWRDEQPSAAARDKTLAMLGLTGSTAAAAAAGSIAPKAVASGWALIAKWLALGMIVIGAATGATVAVVRHHAHVASRATPATLAPPHVLPAPLPRAVTTAPTPLAIAEAPTAPTARARVATPASSSILEQVAALDRARNALDSGDPGRAVHLVDAYEAEHPSGAFIQEAEVVRIESLAREGRTAEADRAGKHFLATFPKSPHDARVRALLGYAP